MSFKHVLGMACGLALAGGVNAQTAPPARAPAQAPAQARPPQPAPAIPYPPAVYQVNNASKALNLTPDQINRLNQANREIQARYRYAYNQMGSLNGAARTQRLRILNQQYALDWSVATQNIFSKPQLNRYRQLNYQYGGFNSLYDPAVQKRLNLTQAQLKSLGDSVNWSDQQLQNINRVGAIDPARATQMYDSYWRAHQERFNTLLTPNQQRAWREMTGEPFTFQPTFTPAR